MLSNHVEIFPTIVKATGIVEKCLVFNFQICNSEYDSKNGLDEEI